MLSEHAATLSEVEGITVVDGQIVASHQESSYNETGNDPAAVEQDDDDELPPPPPADDADFPPPPLPSPLIILRHEGRSKVMCRFEEQATKQNNLMTQLLQSQAASERNRIDFSITAVTLWR